MLLASSSTDVGMWMTLFTYVKASTSLIVPTPCVTWLVLTMSDFRHLLLSLWMFKLTVVKATTTLIVFTCIFVVYTIEVPTIFHNFPERWRSSQPSQHLWERRKVIVVSLIWHTYYLQSIYELSSMHDYAIQSLVGVPYDSGNLLRYTMVSKQVPWSFPIHTVKFFLKVNEIAV